MSENEERQVEQYCPTLHDVVVLVVNGKVEGHMIRGVVKECYTWKRCPLDKEFCWKTREILTALS